MTAWSTSTRRAALPPGWGRTRRHILARDPHCRLRYDGCTLTSTEVDHAGHRDNHHPDALRGVCSSCHLKRTLAQAAAARPTSRRPDEKHPGLR